MTDDERRRGVIAASAGNHGQGVAYAARHLGLRAIIVMPQTTPEIKVQAVREMGAEVVLAGDSYADAQAHCDGIVRSSGFTFVHPFDDPLVIAGQGTIGNEILRHRLGGVSAVFVPVGGGGLIAGIASFVKALRPDVRMRTLDVNLPGLWKRVRELRGAERRDRLASTHGGDAVGLFSRPPRLTHRSGANLDARVRGRTINVRRSDHKEHQAHQGKY